MSEGTNKGPGYAKFIPFIAVVFMLPFICIGIGMIVSGIRLVASGSPSGPSTLIFGIIWCVILAFIVIFMMRALKLSSKSITERKIYKPDNNTNTGDYISPKDDPRFDYEWMKHDDCEADHDDDEDSVRKGYE